MLHDPRLWRQLGRTQAQRKEDYPTKKKMKPEVRPKGAPAFDGAVQGYDYSHGCNEGLGHAFKGSDRINLDRAWVTLGLDGIAFRGQFRAVPADNLTLPGGTRFLAYAISQAKRGAQWERKRPSSLSADFSTTWIHT